MGMSYVMSGMLGRELPRKGSALRLLLCFGIERDSLPKISPGWGLRGFLTSETSRVGKEALARASTKSTPPWASDNL